MGIFCAIWQLAPDTIQDLEADPSIIEDVIEELKDYNQELEESDKVYLDLDKSWSMLSFLITKKFKDSEFGFLTKSGETVGDIDLGYGPARYLSPDSVRKIVRHFGNTSIKDLWQGLALADVPEKERYPFSVDEPLEEVLENLSTHFAKLKDFLARTTKLGRGILVYMF